MDHPLTNHITCPPLTLTNFVSPISHFFPTSNRDCVSIEQRSGGRDIRVVVEILRELNQVYGAVGTVGRQDTTLEHVEKIQKSLLILS
jgi:hypothetical protein